MSITINRCKRCGHKWAQRGESKPKTCPNPACRSPYWDKERTRPRPEARKA